MRPEIGLHVCFGLVLAIDKLAEEEDGYSPTLSEVARLEKTVSLLFNFGVTNLSSKDWTIFLKCLKSLYHNFCECTKIPSSISIPWQQK